MANTPNDYRDPKVSTTEKSSSRNWLWIALAVIAGLILLAFLFGAFGGGDDVDAVATEDGVVIEEDAVDDVEEATD